MKPRRGTFRKITALGFNNQQDSQGYRHHIGDWRERTATASVRPVSSGPKITGTLRKILTQALTGHVPQCRCVEVLAQEIQPKCDTCNLLSTDSEKKHKYRCWRLMGEGSREDGAGKVCSEGSRGTGQQTEGSGATTARSEERKEEW